jgi:nitroreductase
VVRATYEQFLELCQYRRSIRRFKPDPLPQGTAEKILECARLSMSGANSQSWEFIVVQDKETRKKLWGAYAAGTRLATAMEKMRVREYRHPVFSIPDEELEARQKEMVNNLLPAPLLIIPLYDPRKQWSYEHAHTPSRCVPGTWQRAL